MSRSPGPVLAAAVLAGASFAAAAHRAHTTGQFASQWGEPCARPLPVVVSGSSLTWGAAAWAGV